MTNKVIGSECKFAVHIPSHHPDAPDTHLIKECLHMEDGTTKPNVRLITDFKRPYYVTKPSKRVHKQKKEWELIDNLLEKNVTQSKLRDEVARSLDRGWSKDRIKQLSLSPYLYGTDISSTTLIKKLYQDKYPELNSAYSNAVLDIETDVVTGSEDIILLTVIFRDKIFIAVLKNFVTGFSMLEDRFRKAVDKYIGTYVAKYNMAIELYVAEDVVDLIRTAFNRIHEWQPDFLSIWNMDYDIPFILKMLDKYGIDHKDILCDPSVPKDLRICKYRQGIKKKTTASGKVIPINPAMQWHSLVCTSSYYVIDAMCAYKHIRMGKQEESSYSLDNILNKELGIRKLKFEEANNYKGLEWHQFMQTNFKIEYMVYNVFDCLSMIELDNKTKDLCFTLPAFSAASDFANFKSQPKRIADALFFFCKDKGYILGSTGSSLDDEDAIPDEVLGLEGWIITLPAHMTVTGLHCIIEDLNIGTGIRAFTYDSDAVSAYPTCTSIANVSKDTTLRELIAMENVSEETFRAQNLNLILGYSNAIEYATTMFNMPKPENLLNDFLNHMR